jgi:hypothetical protein
MKIVSCACFTLIVTSLVGGELPPPEVTTETASTFYRGFKRLTKEPHFVSSLFSVLCSPPTPEMVERDKRATGPHYHSTVHVYVNQPADETIAKKLARFPPGAVIVKEKLGNEGTVAAIGGMIKRAPGFAPENGDWEYFYTDKKGGFSVGRLQNCADCHAGAKARDYVYTAWTLGRDAHR